MEQFFEQDEENKSIIRYEDAPIHICTSTFISNEWSPAEKWDQVDSRKKHGRRLTAAVIRHGRAIFDCTSCIYVAAIVNFIMLQGQ